MPLVASLPLVSLQRPTSSQQRPSGQRQPLRGSQLPPRAAPPTPGDSGKPRNKDLFPTGDILEITETGTTSTGNVRFEYDGYVVTCERATYESKRDYITFETHVQMETGHETFHAERIGFNRKTREFEALDARTILPPDRVGGSLLEPLRIWGKTMRREGNILKATQGFITTCDLDNPHAKIGFAYAELIPKQRLTLREATIYRYDRPVLRIKHLTIPITDDVHYSYLPNIGRTEEEGYFVKAVIGYSLSRTLPGLLRVDLMQRKGIGLGTDQAYRFGDTAAGRVNFYTLNDKSRGTRNFNGRVDHEQRLGEIDAHLTTDFQNNSYLAATQGSKTQNSNLTLNRNVGKVASTLNFGLNNANNSGSIYKTTAYGLKQQLPLGDKGQLNFSFTGTENLNESGTSRTLRVQQSGELRATGPLGPFQAELATNRNFRNSTSGATSSSFFGGTERLPELTLTTTKLNGLVGKIFSRAILGYGQFQETRSSSSATNSQLSTQRFLLDTEVMPIRKALSNRLSFDSTGRFKQTLYDGDYAAQYVLTHTSRLSQQLSEHGSVDFSYNYNRPYGGTPPGFRNDFVSAVNGLGLDYRVTGGHAAVSFGTGYDLNEAREIPLPGLRRRPWNQLRFSNELRPSENLHSKLVGSYDINTGRLVSLDHYAHYQTAQRLFLDTSLRYDPTTKKLREMRALTATPIFDHDTRLTGNSAYNNITHRFDFNTFALTHSFHDYEITVSYVDQPFGFRTEKGVNLSFRLKAFPSPQTSQGGRFGTPMDTGFGGGF